MKKHLMKTFALAAALVMTLSLTACQPKDSAAPEGEGQGTEENVEPEESADLSDEEYVAKVTELYNKIQEESMAAMTNIDQTDTMAMAEATKKMAETVKPYYDELASLKTSGTYAEAQEQIKTGATASSQMLDISLELLTMGLEGTDMNDEEAMKKVEELQAQATTFAADAQLLTTGITTVMAGNTEAPANDTEAPASDAE